jgi:hypothetical protein
MTSEANHVIGPETDPQVLPVSEPPAPRTPWNRAKAGGALLFLCAAGLTAIGSFQPLYAVEIEYVGEPRRQSLRVTSWDLDFTTNGVPESDALGAPLHGVPLMFAVAALLATALLGLLVATASAGSRFGPAHRLSAVITAVFLVAVVWSVGMQELWYRAALRPPDGPETHSTAGIGPGFWSLLAGAAIAVVAAVLAWRPARANVAEREEPETPVLGIPVVVRRLPDEPNGE